MAHHELGKKPNKNRTIFSLGNMTQEQLADKNAYSSHEPVYLYKELGF